MFIDDVLVSGIEYFINPQFPFLKIPRSFQIQEVELEIANYQNIKFTASLIKYLPKMKKAIFKLRVYTDTDSRGFFMRTYDRKFFKQNGLEKNWVQENHSLSEQKGIIRGLHFQFQLLSIYYQNRHC